MVIWDINLSKVHQSIGGGGDILIYFNRKIDFNPINISGIVQNVTVTGRCKYD